MSNLPNLAFSPAADRNKQAILDVLKQVLPKNGSVLEIASGTGQHIVFFAAAMPHFTWQPTDADAAALPWIAAAVALAGTKLATAQVDTLRCELLKLAAVVTRNTRRIRLNLDSNCLSADIFAHAMSQLRSP